MTREVVVPVASWVGKTAALCRLCHDVTIFDPSKVPTGANDEGVRGPICCACVRSANELREEAGLDLIPVDPGTYLEVVPS